MGNVVNSNFMQMSVNEMVDLMVPLYSTSKPVEIPGLMLWGPPGVGKSGAIRTISKMLEQRTGKKVVVTDVRLLNFNPVDLRGIPVADQKRELAKWLKPQIFQMDESDDVINILFLDEISAAPQSVQAAAYQIVLDRVIGEHKLAANCFVLGAGNRVTDKSVAFKMPKALGNRMTHIEIKCEVDDWKKWAIPYGIDQRIIGYINYRNASLFQFDPSNDDLAFASPRSWEMVDKYLKKINKIDDALPLIAGSIGLGAATEFKTWTAVFTKLPDIRAIFDGKETRIPTEPDVLYALSAALVSNAPKQKKEGLQNLLKYAINMQPEFATLTIKDIVVMEDVRNKILPLPEWVAFSKRYKNLIM